MKPEDYNINPLLYGAKKTGSLSTNKIANATRGWYVLGYDIETRFVKPEMDDGSGLLLSAFYNGEEVLVIDNTSVDNKEIFTPEILRRCLFISHNADFEARWGVRLNFLPGRFACTMVNEKRLLSGQDGFRYGLIPTINRRLGYKSIPIWMDKDLREQFRDCQFFTDELILYNAGDTTKLIELYYKQLEEAEKLGQLFLHNTINSRIIIPIAQAEVRGINHKSNTWLEITKEKQEKALKICKQLDQVVTEEYGLSPGMINPVLKKKQESQEKARIKKEERIIKLQTQLRNLEIKEKTHLKSYKTSLDQLDKLLNTTQELEQEVTGLINWNSDKQVLTALRLLGCPLPIAKDNKTHTMKEGMNKQARTNWMVNNEDSVFMPLMKTYEEYAKLQHIVDSFGEEWINNYVRNGRAFTLLDQAGTTTGRFSSGSKGKPGQPKEYMNIQQIPVRDDTEYRECFIADEGNVIITADYSNCEGSVMAALANDIGAKRIMDMKDSHSYLGTKAWRAVYTHRYKRTGKEEWKELSETYEMNKSTPEKSKERDVFKNSGGLFPVAYGVSANKVAATSKVTEQEGQQMINAVQSEVPLIIDFLDQKSKIASTEGYVLHNTRTGSRRWFTPVLDHNHYGFKLDKSDRITAQSQSRNSPIQGSNSDLMKEAIAMLFLWCNLYKQDIKMLMTVHDELVVECAEDKAEFYADRVKEIMKRAAKNYLIKEIDMDVDVRIAKYWKK